MIALPLFTALTALAAGPGTARMAIVSHPDTMVARILSQPDSTAFSALVTVGGRVLFRAVGPDSVTAAVRADSVTEVLESIRRGGIPPIRFRIAESAGAGLVLRDSTVLVRVLAENRADTTLTPLANALMIRDQVVPRARRDTRSEEDLLLRLLLGLVYPVFLLVLLRIVRLGIRRWERDWRRGLLGIFERLGWTRDKESRAESRRLLRVLVGLERATVYGLAFVVVSFTWFALFPQTRPLAQSLSRHIIEPFLDLLGGTARGFVVVAYTAAVAAASWWITRRIAHRRARDMASWIAPPVVYHPLRIGVWTAALFLILLPYAGAPRLFAVGVLLLLLFGAGLALRPIIEEIAAGLYMSSQYDFSPGKEFYLDGNVCRVVEAGLAHVQFEQAGRRLRYAYTRLLRSEFGPAPASES